MKNNTLKYLILSIIFSFFIISCNICFGTAEVNGSSMSPTYKNDDFLIISKVKHINYYDIVAIKSDTLNRFLCKRVIGLEGDHIVINENGLYRNNELLNEDYVVEDWLQNTNNIDIIVPNDKVFVMGDNRNNSTDSRDLGCLNMSDIWGVSILNLTKSTGITRQTIIKFTVIIWILFILTCIFGKRKSSKTEG